MRCDHLAIAAIAILAFAGGCSTVTIPEPLGEPIAADEAKQLEGVWLNSDGEPLHVKHVQENELRVGGIEWQESKFVASEFTVFLTVLGDQKYINLREKEESAASPCYSFCRVTAPDSEHLLLSYPHVAAFAQPVTDGKLAGEIVERKNSTTVRLSATKEQLAEFLKPEKAAEQFEVNAPAVLRRLRTGEVGT